VVGTHLEGLKEGDGGSAGLLRKGLKRQVGPLLALLEGAPGKGRRHVPAARRRGRYNGHTTVRLAPDGRSCNPKKAVMTRW
jgi:hypothetical protein